LFGSVFFHKGSLFYEKKIFIRVDRKVIGVEELESDVSFSKFFLDRFFYTKDHFFTKKFFFIRVDRRVIGVEELESDGSFIYIYLIGREKKNL
jgi:hypothetical protein